jgi:O-antigen/teichoic acid export membrane protein
MLKKYNTQFVQSVRFLSLSGLYGGVDLTARIFQFAVVMWLAALVSKTYFGEFGILIVTFGMAGILEALPVEYNKYKKEKKLSDLYSAIWQVNAYILFFITLIYLIMISKMKQYVVPAPAFAFAAVLATSICLARAKILEYFFRIEQKHLATFLCKILPIILTYASGAIFLLNSEEKTSIYPFFLGAGIAAMFLMVLIEYTAYYTFEIKWYRFDFTLSKRLFHTSLPYFGVAIFGWFSGYGLNFFIKYFYALDQVAEYTLVMQIGSMALLIMGAMNQVWSPRLLAMSCSLKIGDLVKKDERANFLQGIFLALILLIIIFICWGFPLLHIEAFSKYEKVVQYIPIVFLVYLCRFLFINKWQFFFIYLGEGYCFMKIIMMTGVVYILTIPIFMMTRLPMMIYLSLAFLACSRSIVVHNYARLNWGALIPIKEVTLVIVFSIFVFILTIVKSI